MQKPPAPHRGPLSLHLALTRTVTELALGAWGEWRGLGGIHWPQPQSFSLVTQEAKAQLEVSPGHCVCAKTYGCPCKAPGYHNGVPSGGDVRPAACAGR
uniref:Uncharacterized protein n=1 Tax=Nomascus leucogenys TaxID=61853 RepID=A0A2I3GW69_NOMLE